MESTEEDGRSGSSLHRALGALPTALVLVGLAAVGAWGHRTGWKAPRFSELFGAKETAVADDWCDSHGVPESICIACNPELAGESLPSSVPGDWCEEHGVPESGCTLCNPAIAKVEDAHDHSSEVHVEHGSHEGEDEHAHSGAPSGAAPPIRDPRTCQKHALRVQLASPAVLEKAGIVLGSVVERPMADSVVVNGEVDYDRTRYAKVTARAAGIASRVESKLGQAVEEGTVLALVESPELGRAKAELLEATAAVEVTGKSLERIERSATSGFRTETERLEAEAAARQARARLLGARQRLEALGVADGEEASPSASRLAIRSPLPGVVVAADVVAGEAVDPSRVVFEVADTRRMGVEVDVPLSEAHRISLGQQVIFRPDDARDEVVYGEISWISTAVDERTRTLKVRADVKNEEGTLRAHTFGRAQVIVRTSPSAVAVPNEAVQWEGCCYVVFVRVADEVFQARKVRLGARDAGYTEVLVGVLPGEVIATAGSHVLKSEILKSALGAGCVDD